MNSVGKTTEPNFRTARPTHVAENTATVEPETFAHGARSAVDPNADLVQFYFRDIRPISGLLSVTQEQELSRAVQQSKRARHRLSRAPEIGGEERARLEAQIAIGENAREN